jgi:hypothetical protein
MLIAGEAQIELELDLDFGKFDGLALMLGLPVLSTLLFLILSPLSYFVHRQMTKKKQTK